MCFCGDAATGKTALVSERREMDEVYRPTMMAESVTYEVKEDSSEVMKVAFWDLVGRESHPSILQESDAERNSV